MPQKHKKYFVPLCAFISTLLIDGVIPVFATSGVVDGFKTLMGTLYSIIRTVSVPVAAVALAYCGLQIITRGEAGMETGKRLAKYILIGVVVIFLAGQVGILIRRWFSGTPYTPSVLGLNPD